jgi:hypothetical protein
MPVVDPVATADLPVNGIFNALFGAMAGRVQACTLI